MDIAAVRYTFTGCNLEKIHHIPSHQDLVYPLCSMGHWLTRLPSHQLKYLEIHLEEKKNLMFVCFASLQTWELAVI